MVILYSIGFTLSFLHFQQNAKKIERKNYESVVVLARMEKQKDNSTTLSPQLEQTLLQVHPTHFPALGNGVGLAVQVDAGVEAAILVDRAGV